MKAKELMIVLFIIIVLLIVIIVAVNANKNKGNEENTQTPEIGVVEENKVEEFVEVQEDGSKVNTSEELKKTKTIDGLEISNIRLVENNNVSQVVADIKNPTNKTLGDFPVDIIVKDKEGKKITTIGAYIDKVNPGETVELNASATSDFANAYDFEIVK